MRSPTNKRRNGIRDVTGTGSFTDTDDQVEMPQPVVKVQPPPSPQHATHLSHPPGPQDDWSEFDNEIGGFSEEKDWADNPTFQTVMVVLAVLLFFVAIIRQWYWLAMFCIIIILTSNLVWPRSHKK